MLYRIKWISGYYKNEGCTKPPFGFKIYNEIKREDGSDRTNLYCDAVINSDNETEAIGEIKKYFNDFVIVSCKKIRNKRNLFVYILSFMGASIITILWGILSLIASVLYGIGLKGLGESFKKMIAIFSKGRKFIFKNMVR